MKSANNLMIAHLNRIVTPIELHTALVEIIKAGFILVNDCFFLKYFFDIRGTPSFDTVQDETGAEVFVNSFHIDDYVDTNHLEQALAFAKAAYDIATTSKFNLLASQLCFVITLSEYGANIKTFRVRANQPYLTDDLEGYEQPILICTSSDLI